MRRHDVVQKSSSLNRAPVSRYSRANVGLCAPASYRRVGVARASSPISQIVEGSLETAWRLCGWDVLAPLLPPCCWAFQQRPWAKRTVAIPTASKRGSAISRKRRWPKVFPRARLRRPRLILCLISASSTSIGASASLRRILSKCRTRCSATGAYRTARRR